MTLHRNQVLAEIESTGVVAVIRADSGTRLADVCLALRDGGVSACEITMTTPNALQAISEATAALGDQALIGAGTVLDAETARAAILAGAQFVVSPILDPQIIAMGHRYDRPVMPGALTPTEIVAAWTAGADIVKVFPANQFGPGYFKDLKGPLPHIRLTPTGGVDLNTAADWIRAGAVCLGVGSALVKREFIDAGDWAALSTLARRYVDIVRDARG